MSCNAILSKLSGTDLQVMAEERRADCVGELWDSGILRRDSELDRLANGGTYATDHHFWSFTGRTDNNTSFPGTNEPCGPCNTVGKKSAMTRKLFRTNCWDINYLDEQVNINRPAEAVISDLLPQWELDIAERDLGAVIQGVYLNNQADDASDLIYDASDAATNSVPNFVTKDAVLEAVGFMGCRRNELGGMIVHTDIMRSLEKRDLITFAQVNCDDGACVERAFFNSRPIIEVEDDCLIDPNTQEFISVLYRDGAIAYGTGTPVNGALEADADPSRDCGAGGTNWYQRAQYALHPVGWSNIFDADAASSDGNMSTTNLKDPTSWCRVHEIRNVGLAFIRSTEQ